MKNFSYLLGGLLLLLLMACKETPKAVDTSSKTPVATENDTKKPFIQGTYFEGANGVFFDKNDRLHVASVTGRKIAVVDTKTGDIIEKFGPEEGVDGPDDLTIGPDGSMYHTNLLMGIVGRRTPTGEVTQQLSLQASIRLLFLKMVVYLLPWIFRAMACTN